MASEPSGWTASVTPFLPLSWVPDGDMSPPSERQPLAERLLDLNFDLIARAMDGLYDHPIRTAVDVHPVHRCSFSQHQFNLLRYGLVLDPNIGLVLAEVPRGLERRVRVGGEPESPDAPRREVRSLSQVNPLLPEHVLCVYRRVASQGDASAQDRYEPVFRLVFRNEAFNDTDDVCMAREFPAYFLRAVFVSNERYYDRFQKMHTRQVHLAKLMEDTADIGAAEVAAAIRARLCDAGEFIVDAELIQLCDLWMAVLDSLVPPAEGGASAVASLTVDTSSAFLSSRVVDGGKAVTVAPITHRRPCPLLTRCTYYAQNERMCERVTVVRKSPELLAAWRAGAYDVVHQVADRSASSSVATADRRHPCVRLFLRNIRNPCNYIEENEICAFLPYDDECHALQTYPTIAAERLHQWVLRGLLTAELHGVHCLFVELHTADVIEQCVGLLMGSGTNRDYEVLFHVCKIVVETVGDFVQHSGVVWKVYIVVTEADTPIEVAPIAAGSTEPPADARSTTGIADLCLNILRRIQHSKRMVEEKAAASRRSLPAVEGASRPSTNASGASETATAPVHQPRADGAMVLQSMGSCAADYVARCTTDEGASHMVSVLSDRTARTMGPLGSSLRQHATTMGVFLADEDMYPIFLRVSGGKSLASVADVVALLLSRHAGGAPTGSTGLHTTPSSSCPAGPLDAEPLECSLRPIDGCGVPFDRASVTACVLNFCRREGDRAHWWRQPTACGRQATTGSPKHPGISANAVAAPVPSAPAPPMHMNYVEFSMLLLSMARL